MHVYAYGNPPVWVKAREVCMSSKPDYHAFHHTTIAIEEEEEEEERSKAHARS
jgi:hypothetical protein